MRKLSILLCLTLLAACSTMEGFGRDVRSLGNTITGSAEEGRQQINH